VFRFPVLVAGCLQTISRARSEPACPWDNGIVRVRGVLFDMDGVIYNDDVPIAGAAEAVRWAVSHGVPHLFVTNTTSKGRKALVEKLRRMGIETGPSHILTPCVAASEWLRTEPPGAVALFVRRAAREEFQDLPLVNEGAETGAAYVVIGDLGPEWDFKTLNRAFRLLHHQPDARLIALGMTRYWQTAEGVSLDVAPFVAALEHATGRQPQVFGKPAEAFFRAAAQQLGLARNEIVMIGDDIDTDIGGAQAAGLRGALVQTGKFRAADLEGPVQPDAVLASVAGLPDWWRTAGASPVNSAS
jgi:phospholysine phosphohistidine inorganic pyrophosphate phosphatase